MTPQEMSERAAVVNKLRALTSHHAPTVLDEKFYTATMPIKELRIILALLGDVELMADCFLFGDHESHRQTAFDLLSIMRRRPTEEGD